MRVLCVRVWVGKLRTLEAKDGEVKCRQDQHTRLLIRLQRRLAGFGQDENQLN